MVLGLESEYAGGRKASYKVMAKGHVTAEGRMNQGRGGRGEREGEFPSRDMYLLSG